MREANEQGVCVGEPVCVPLPVPLGVGEPVAVSVGVWLPLPLLLSEVLPELEAETPMVSDAVGEADTVELALTVELAVTDSPPRFSFGRAG
jgi:hypothetical protein